jgi:hypothetical protein
MPMQIGKFEKLAFVEKFYEKFAPLRKNRQKV